MCINVHLQLELLHLIVQQLIDLNTGASDPQLWIRYEWKLKREIVSPETDVRSVSPSSSLLCRSVEPQTILQFWCEIKHKSICNTNTTWDQHWCEIISVMNSKIFLMHCCWGASEQTAVCPSRHMTVYAFTTKETPALPSSSPIHPSPPEVRGQLNNWQRSRFSDLRLLLWGSCYPLSPTAAVTELKPQDSAAQRSRFIQTVL